MQQIELDDSYFKCFSDLSLKHYVTNPLSVQIQKNKILNCREFLPLWWKYVPICVKLKSNQYIQLWKIEMNRHLNKERKTGHVKGRALVGGEGKWRG
jgi:hypothetical protein